MIRLIGSQKGGPGKSTIATNLAVAYARAGRDVALVDGDRQRSTARWYADRVENGHEPAIACLEKLDNMRETLIDLNGRYDEVIVDVAGRDSKEMRTAMLAAHQMIVTVRPSQLDLDTLDHMSEVVADAQIYNPHLEVFGLITQAPTHPGVSESTDAGEYFADFPALPPLRTVIYERKAYRDVIPEGLGVLEWTNRKAAAEITALMEEIH